FRRQELSGDGDRVLCRGWRSQDPATTLLAVFPGTERPAPASLKELRMNTDYGIRSCFQHRISPGMSGPKQLTSDAKREQSDIAPGFDVESFIHEYYDAWGGTDLNRIMSYYSEDVVLQIPGLLMEGKKAVRDQFAVPFTTAFPGNHHIVKGMIFGPGVVNVEFIFEAQHQGPFAGHAASGARIKLPGCGVYQYDSAKRQ